MRVALFRTQKKACSLFFFPSLFIILAVTYKRNFHILNRVLIRMFEYYVSMKVSMLSSGGQITRPVSERLDFNLASFVSHGF